MKNAKKEAAVETIQGNESVATKKSKSKVKSKGIPIKREQPETNDGKF